MLRKINKLIRTIYDKLFFLLLTLNGDEMTTWAQRRLDEVEREVEQELINDFKTIYTKSKKEQKRKNLTKNQLKNFINNYESSSKIS